MKRFAELYRRIDSTMSTNAKVAAIADYLAVAPADDAAWALFFLTGRRLQRLLPTRLLHEWTVEMTALPEWLVRESYSAVGDLAEAIALLLDRRLQPLEADQVRRRAESSGLPFDEPESPAIDARVDGISLAEWIEQRIQPLRRVDDEERRTRVLVWWSRLDRWQLFVLNKLLTGEFRVGVSHTLVVRAVAQFAGLTPPIVEHRLMGNWEPSAAAFAALTAQAGARDVPSQPYPFCLATPIEHPVELGERADWLVEWKWDGIRAQLIRRGGDVFLWSRGEELITDRFPEVVAAARALPDGVVLDGELLAFSGGRPRPFADLQQRIGRMRRVDETAATIPVVFVAYDLLEQDGEDIRHFPMRERRETLAALITGVPPGAALKGRPCDGNRSEAVIRISEQVDADSWDTLATLRDASRAHGVEGLMLKRWTSAYHTGRRRGDWWKWKIEPHTIDAVLIYAQPGSGRRASLFTDYTFGVWDRNELVPVAKAYSGLNDTEIDELDRWIRRHTTERFGPVSAVEPVHVFELGFERIARSTRHRSGIAVRFPRMLRWRRDKTPREADTLETLRALLATQDDSVPRR
jgi:DNA ligase 1